VSLLRHFLLLLIVFLLVPWLAACSPVVEKGGKPPADWSRSMSLGGEAVGSIGLSVDELGENVHVVWPIRKGGVEWLRYVKVDQTARIVFSRDLKFTGELKAPRLSSALQGRTHLVWSSRSSSLEGWRLWHVLLDEAGNVTGKRSLVSTGDGSVGRYALAPDGKGGILVAWDAGQTGGLFVGRINPAGELISGPVMIASQGHSPVMDVDSQGWAHMAYLDGKVIHYAWMPVDDFEQASAEAVVDLAKGGTLGSTGDILQGPAMGYAGEWIYLVWSVLSTSDTESGSAIAEYVSFPAREPAQTNPERLLTLASQEKEYRDYRGSFGLTALGPPPVFSIASQELGREVTMQSEQHGDWVVVSGGISSFIMTPSAMIGDQDELAVAVAASQEFRLDEQMEITTLVFSEGGYRGYSVSSQTNRLSDNPVLAADSAGELYLVWREGSRGEKVYFASTAPNMLASLDRLGFGDAFTAVMKGTTEGLTSLAFTPIIGMWWILPGLLILGGWKLVREQESVNAPSSWPVLLAAVGIYLALKVLFLPTILYYVPFSAWIYLPSSLAAPLRVGMPFLILGLGLLSANYVRVRYSDSSLAFYLAFTITDAALSLLIYGVNYLGAF